ncbi:hypothetical protein, partial [Pseudorhizobium halotolerans]|uniref:hypothetical protein n=1 Tax=Pseudorhizobium halotolerans TaxID=1233081 RepID=UPI001B7D39A5
GELLPVRSPFCVCLDQKLKWRRAGDVSVSSHLLIFATRLADAIQGSRDFRLAKRVGCIDST